MEVIWEQKGVEEEEEEEEEVVLVDGISAFWTFPPNIRFPSLVQLEPPWLFFMVAGGEEEGNMSHFVHLQNAE